MQLSQHYERLFRNILYPLYNKMIGRDGQKVFLERRESQYFSQHVLKEMRLIKLKAILCNAREHVPYYRSEFKRIGFYPEDLNSLDEFEGLNFFIDKSIVRDNSQAFIADNVRKSKLNWHRTGGSTGTPLHFPTDKPTDAASASAIMKALDWWNIRLGSRHAMFWGSPTFIKRKPTDVVKQLGNDIRNRAMNRLFILNYDIGERNFDRIFHKIEKFRPIYIRGMPSSLAIFAMIAKKKGVKLCAGRPLIIHSACEQLFDWQVQAVEDVFGAPVLNTYGLSEVGDIAYEAPCRELHVMDEDVLIELFPMFGEEQEIVATQLNNLSSPLIRYRTGDIAGDVTNCACQLNSRVLKGLKGRAHDFIVSPKGHFLHGQFLTHLIVYERGVRKYQVIQRSRDHLMVRLMVEPTFDDTAFDRIRAAIRSYMGSEVNVDFEILDDIPLTAAGKHRWIVSELGPLADYV